MQNLFSGSRISLRDFLANDNFDSAGIVGDGVGVGVQTVSSISSLDVILQAARVAGFMEMISQGGGELFQPGGVQPLQCFAHALVKLAAMFEQDGVVSCFLGQGMAEGEFQLGMLSGFPDQIDVFQFLEVLIQLDSSFRQALQNAVVEGPANHSGEL